MIILRLVKISYFLFFINLVFFSSSFAQMSETMGVEKDSLKTLFNQLAISKTDSVREVVNKKIYRIMNQALQNEKDYSFFDSVSHLGKLESTDKNIRIYNWNLVHEDGQFEYFAFLLHYEKQSKTYKVFSLTDRSRFIVDAKEATLSPQTWFGVLYYQIIVTKKFGRKFYTLLGWDGYNDYKNRKIIDVLSFTKDGVPKFGAPIFSKGDFDANRRILFEYANRASMTLTYDSDEKIIVFDNLSPTDASLKGQFQYYGPDGSYSGFEYKRGKWIFKQGVDARNPKSNHKKKKKKADKF